MPQQQNASEKIRRMYEALDEHSQKYSSLIANYDRHSIRVSLEDYDVEPDDVALSGDSFPYLKTALIDEAVTRGDIRQKNRTESFLYDAT